MLKLISCFSMGIGGNGRPTLELLGNVAHAGAEKYPCKKYIRLYDQVVFFYFFFFKSKEKSSIYHTRCINSSSVGTNLFRCSVHAILNLHLQKHLQNESSIGNL